MNNRLLIPAAFIVFPMALFQSCSPGFKASNSIRLSQSQDCLLDGQPLTNGQTANAYRLRIAPTGTSCVVEARTCTKGILSGSSPYSSCIQSDVIAGFRVNIREAALQSPRLTEAVDRLQTRLEEANSHSKAFSSLHGKVEFWITDAKYIASAATYHLSANYLIENGKDPNMAKGIEILNVENFLSWNVVGDQPMMILHELAHAYQDQFLGTTSTQVLNAYDSAKSSGIYNSVRYHDQNGPLLQAYAMTNALEYFAELSEAYFGVNDYYPFNQAQLQSFDPVGYQLMTIAWGR